MASDSQKGSQEGGVRNASSSLTYASSGVNIEAGNETVRRIKSMVASTRRPEQLDGLGGFAGMMEIPPGYRRPALVACSDGVGTKILIAIALNKHDTIGIDLVAMCVNDLIVNGAQPLFLLDYIATGKLEPIQVERIISGIVEGCRQSGCSLLGGETAELPDMYQDAHYDLAATAVGVVEADSTWGAALVKQGDLVIGLSSSGLHSNGYSLARKALLDPAYANLSLDAMLPGGSGCSVGEALLCPTTIYEPIFKRFRDLSGTPIHAAAHITGGGLLENPQRSLPESLCVELDLRKVSMPPILKVIANQGVQREEMLRTFNCGLGMLLYIDRDRLSEVTEVLVKQNQAFVELGQIGLRTSSSAPQVLIES